MNRIIRLAALAFLAVSILTGCATQQPNQPLPDNFWKDKKQKVTVAKRKAPAPQFFAAGNQGLLDMAINNAMMKPLNDHISHADLSSYHTLSSRFAEGLKQRNISPISYTNPLSPEEKDYFKLVSQTNSDKLLIIKLEAVGAIRQYMGFIPSGAPQAYCSMVGELVDSKDNNKILWRHQTTIMQPIEGKWDQPPNYPNFNVALRSAVDNAEQELLDSFFSGH